MSKIMKFLLLVSGVVFYSCASTSSIQKNTPDWVIAPDMVYSSSAYLTAVGYAPDRVSAENEAIAALSKVIKQKVTAESVASSAFDTNVTTDGVSRDFSSSVQTSTVLEEIAGIKIQEVWTAKDGVVYALALINREESGTYYGGKIEDLNKAITSEIAFSAENQGSFESVTALYHALELAYVNEYYLDILSVTNPVKYKMTSLSYGSAQNIEVLTQRQLEKVVISLIITGDVDNRIGGALSTVITDAKFKTVVGPSELATYELKVSLSLSEMTLSGDTNNKFVRFVLDTQLVNIKTGKNVFPFTVNGREAHLTVEEARQRALRTLENEIKNKYSIQFSAFLNTIYSK